jgi:hypothetical protein
VAVVVWVFAGGGESEVRGLIPFLEENYGEHTFQRKSPIRRKPSPRPSAEPGYGRTGKSLADQIGKLLSESLKGQEDCNLVLVIDDLDCHDPNARQQLFSAAVGQVGEASEISYFVGFASPEIEAWIVADWGNTVAKDPDFRGCHQEMQHWLSTQRSVHFDDPETFSHYDPDRKACHDKLSEAIVDSSIECCERVRYSKATHTARFLRQLSTDVVSQKCPQFRKLHARLSQPQ